jgi:hypothetical protein
MGGLKAVPFRVAGQLECWAAGYRGAVKGWGVVLGR